MYYDNDQSISFNEKSVSELEEASYAQKHEYDKQYNQQNGFFNAENDDGKSRRKEKRHYNNDNGSPYRGY